MVFPYDDEKEENYPDYSPDDSSATYYPESAYDDETPFTDQAIQESASDATFYGAESLAPAEDRPQEEAQKKKKRPKLIRFTYYEFAIIAVELFLVIYTFLVFFGIVSIF